MVDAKKMLALDHIAVRADSLQAGREAVEAALGVTLQPGGRHARFGTHNLLLGLDDGLYLEVIAIDPDAAAPDGARWFDLDCFAGCPRPGPWVCRCGDLDTALAQFPQVGRAVALSRSDLRWRMAVPENGALPFDNLFPALIQWQGGRHPAARLAPSGLRLARMTLSHPRAGDLAALLSPVLDDSRLAFVSGAPGLGLEFDAPGGGRRVLA